MKRYIVRLEAEERERLERLVRAAIRRLIGSATPTSCWRSTSPNRASRPRTPRRPPAASPGPHGPVGAATVRPGRVRGGPGTQETPAAQRPEDVRRREGSEVDRPGLRPQAPGPGRWTLQLLAIGRCGWNCSRLLAGDGAAHASKNELKPWLRKMWCIPPEATPSSSARWRACWRRTRGLTIRSVRWSASTKEQATGRRSRDADPGVARQVERHDYEYVRTDGQPVHAGRTAAGLASRGRDGPTHQVGLRPANEGIGGRASSDGDEDQAGDGQSQHASVELLYESFPPDEARRIVERIERRTPPSTAVG